jgi:hypothetical protein
MSAILKFNLAPVFRSIILRSISSKNSAYQTSCLLLFLQLDLPKPWDFVFLWRHQTCISCATVAFISKQRLYFSRCPKLVILNITTTRVSKEGVALFLACHPNAIRIEHEESFHALSFIRIQANQVSSFLACLSGCLARMRTVKHFIMRKQNSLNGMCSEARSDLGWTIKWCHFLILTLDGAEYHTLFVTQLILLPHWNMIIGNVNYQVFHVWLLDHDLITFTSDI